MTFIISTMRQMCLLVAMVMMCSVSGRSRDNLREAAETEPTMDDNTNNVRRQETTVCGRRQIPTSKRDEGKGGSNDDNHSDHLDKILGGSDVTYGQVPWHVIIYKRRDGEDQRVCGGAIINEFWIITGAICASRVRPGEVRLVVGDHSLFDTDEGQRRYKAKRLIVHPRYRGSTMHYDIALIQVKPTNDRGILFNNYVQPICLPVAGESPAENDNLTISGWGDGPEDYDARPLTILQTAVLPVMNHTQCINELSGYDIGNRVLCVGRSRGGTTDACELDIGGPATYQSGDTHILAGIIVQGSSCTLPVNPVLLTNVLAFRNWINWRINRYCITRQGSIPPRAD